MTDLPPPIPVLEVFYASSCAPCRAELPVLAEFARARPGQLRIVILHEDDRARGELAAAAPALASAATVVPGSDLRTVLRDAGDADGILPYSTAKRGDGATCASWRGMLTVARIRKLLGQCGA